MAGHLNVQVQFNHWLELSREAFADERAILANAKQIVDNQHQETGAEAVSSPSTISIR